MLDAPEYIQSLALADDVICADVVTCFDACRGAGFADVGVAEAVQ